MNDMKKEIKLREELINNRNKWKEAYYKNKLNLIGIQENVSDVLKPVIDPLKSIEKTQSQNQNTQSQNQNNQLQIYSKQYLKTLNTDPIPNVTRKLPYGIKPEIFKNTDPPKFEIGGKSIPIDLKNGTFEIDNYKIPISQKLINLINGDDNKFEKYKNKHYINYLHILEFVKEGSDRIPKRMENLRKHVKNITSMESILDEVTDSENDNIDDENVYNLGFISYNCKLFYKFSFR